MCRPWPAWPPPLLPGALIPLLNASWSPGNDAVELTRLTQSARTALRTPQVNRLMSKVIIHHAEEEHCPWDLSSTPSSGKWMSRVPSKLTYRNLSLLMVCEVLWVFEVPLWSIKGYMSLGRRVSKPTVFCASKGVKTLILLLERCVLEVLLKMYLNNNISGLHLFINVTLIKGRKTPRLLDYFLVWMKIEEVNLFLWLFIVAIRST